MMKASAQASHTKTCTQIIDDLIGLISEQIGFLRMGQINNALQLCSKAEDLSSEVGSLPESLKKRNIEKIISLRAMYDELSLCLETSKHDIMGQLKKISDGKKAVSVYRKANRE